MILPIRIKLKKLEETVNMSYFHYAEKNSQQKSEIYIFFEDGEVPDYLVIMYCI